MASRVICGERSQLTDRTSPQSAASASKPSPAGRHLALSSLLVGGVRGAVQENADSSPRDHAVRVWRERRCVERQNEPAAEVLIATVGVLTSFVLGAAFILFLQQDATGSSGVARGEIPDDLAAEGVAEQHGALEPGGRYAVHPHAGASVPAYPLDGGRIRGHAPERPRAPLEAPDRSKPEFAEPGQIGDIDPVRGRERFGCATRPVSAGRRCRQGPLEPSLDLPTAADQADYVKTGPVRLFLTFQFSLQDRLEEKLPRVQAPMLVVRGALDPICNQEWAEFVARRSPHGRLVVIPNVAHTLVYTAAPELVAASLPFLQGSA